MMRAPVPGPRRPSGRFRLVRPAGLALAIALGVLGPGGFGPGAGPLAAQPVIEATTGIQHAGPPELRAPVEAAAATDAPFPETGANSLVAAPEPESAPAPAPTPEAGSLPTLPAGPLPAQPVVIELFTAQGCSSCPPADALLADMADRPDLLALAFHVDYWDYLGWQDGFASPAFTRRQQAYARAFHERGLYTPQIIVGGTDTLLIARPADVETLIAAHRARPPALAVTVEREGDRHLLTLTPRRGTPARLEVLFLRYLPRRVVQMDAGENRGREVEYRNIVARVDKLADWDGRRVLRLAVRPGDAAGGEAPEGPILDARGQPLPADTRHAIIVQQAGPGPVLAAIRLD